MYKIVIVGGGISGLSLGITLASGFLKNKLKHKILIIDNHRSDALKARFFNAPGIEFGETGENILEKMKLQFLKYKSGEIIKASVQIINSQNNNNYSLQMKNGDTFQTEYLVLATGYKIFDIDLDEKLSKIIEKVKYPYSDKNRIMFANINNQINDNIWVCGLIAGAFSQFASASASGVDTGLKILAQITGKFEIIHDKFEDDFEEMMG